MTRANNDQPTLSPAIRRALARLRGAIRAYVAWECAAMALLWIGLGFWFTMAFDRLFEPIWPVRVVLLAVPLGVVAWIVATLGVSRLSKRLPDSSMAMLLERQFPELDERLLTAVELLERGAEGVNPHLLAKCHEDAAEAVRAIDPRACLDRRPLRKKIGLSALLIMSVVVYASLWPDYFALWSQRLLAMSSEPWPRSARLEAVGFNDEGVAKIARGDDFDLIVRADMGMPLVPETILVRGRTESGRMAPITMTRQGVAEPGVDEFQEFVHGFRGVLTSLELDVFGGDAEIRGLRVEVVDSPTLVDPLYHCEYPDYMDRRAEDVDAGVVTPVPMGTRVTLRAAANKDLVRAVIRRGDEAFVVESGGVRPATSAADRDAPEHTGNGDLPTFREIEYVLPATDEDQTLLIDLHDADGISTREPITLTLVAVEDDPPQVTAMLHGIGSAITPSARLPVRGTVIDDHGLEEIWFEFAVDQFEPETRLLSKPSGNATESPIDTAFEASDLGLTPGQTLALSIAAADRCTLGEKRNVGRGDRWEVGVVTEKELLSMLEAREIVLRQRFEQLIDDVRMTRESFNFMTFPLTDVDEASDDADSEESEDADTASNEEDESPEDAEAHALGIRKLRLQRVKRDSSKESYETSTVARAFLDIRDELANNRIYTEERKERIERQIVEPLEFIVDDLFPELDRRIYDFEQTVESTEFGPANRDSAKQQLDVILVAMEAVRDRMVEMETYNEAVEMLRQIIETQREIRKKTEDRRKEGLRDLLLP